MVRRSTGNVVRFRPDSRGFCNVGIYKCKGREVRERYHRIKFCLHHGYLPNSVDHRDRDRTNNSIGNLRAATLGQQQHNQSQDRRKVELPRGVYPQKGGRYHGRFSHNKKRVYLGSFDTPEEASEAVEARLKELYGDYYSPQ